MMGSWVRDPAGPPDNEANLYPLPRLRRALRVANRSAGTVVPFKAADREAAATRVHSKIVDVRGPPALKLAFAYALDA